MGRSSSILRSSGRESAQIPPKSASITSAARATPDPRSSASTQWREGQRHEPVRARAVLIEVRYPLTCGRLRVRGHPTLHKETGPKAACKCRCSPRNQPSRRPRRRRMREQGGKSTGPTRTPVVSIRHHRADGSGARKRIETASTSSAMFPAALCYTKIVPVDEVVHAHALLPRG